MMILQIKHIQRFMGIYEEKLQIIQIIIKIVTKICKKL
jgi:hypothetical protein